MVVKNKIGLVFDMRFGWARGEMRGVIAYARNNARPWLFTGGPDTAATWAMLRRWRPDGLLVSSCRLRWHGSAPIVEALAPDKHGCVILDNDAIGALVARHFLERGLVNLAFVGERGICWSEERGIGFERTWKNEASTLHGASFHRFNLATSRLASHVSDWPPAPAELATWLATLPRPAGILAYRDLRACEVATVCREQGLRVPEDIAIVGVDNDELLCETTNPPLSSVSVPWEEIGRHMGERLDALMRGRPTPRRLPVVRPGPLVLRQSSDIYAGADEAVMRAYRFVRDNVAQSIGVEDVARAACVSRRGLEYRFQRQLGRSPLAEIRRIRLDLVQRLLRDTPLSLAAVAGRTGFGSGQRLAAVFKTLTGKTPGEYRARLKADSFCDRR